MKTSLSVSKFGTVNDVQLLIDKAEVQLLSRELVVASGAEVAPLVADVFAFEHDSLVGPHHEGFALVPATVDLREGDDSPGISQVSPIIGQGQPGHVSRFEWLDGEGARILQVGPLVQQLISLLIEPVHQAGQAGGYGLVVPVELPEEEVDGVVQAFGCWRWLGAAHHRSGKYGHDASRPNGAQSCRIDHSLVPIRTAGP